MYKFFVISALIGFTAAIAPKRYRPSGVVSQVSSNDVHAEIRSQVSDIRPDGFSASLETTNGISQQSAGDALGNIQGQFSWTSPEGENIQITYVADENGYRPQGALIPTPLPIPQEIIRAIEYIRTHPQRDEAVRYGH